jgi:hypothetical protein
VIETFAQVGLLVIEPISLRGCGPIPLGSFVRFLAIRLGHLLSILGLSAGDQAHHDGSDRTATVPTAVATSTTIRHRITVLHARPA